MVFDLLKVRRFMTSGFHKKSAKKNSYLTTGYTPENNSHSNYKKQTECVDIKQ